MPMNYYALFEGTARIMWNRSLPRNTCEHHSYIVFLFACNYTAQKIYNSMIIIEIQVLINYKMHFDFTTNELSSIIALTSLFNLNSTFSQYME